ncbi:Aluminum-activated malate transporter [Sesbania bispinosa]|nr:Aluminum-activated malate transporter [Sesbania bispinosa]
MALSSAEHMTGCTHASLTLPGKSWAKLVKVKSIVKKIGQDDPRRVIHSFKVGFALVLISILQHFRPSFYGFGDNIIWAVLTVVLVLEFSVGATLGKGLNRMLATALAGALGLVTHRLATLSGKKGKLVLSSIFVFVIAETVTFMRFSPWLKARYDYGLLIFILTFCLVSLDYNTDSELLEIAQERLLTIIIGSCLSIVICICICPVWVGKDLHNQIAANIQKVADFLEGRLFGKMGTVSWPTPYELRSRIQETCTNISLESGKALKEASLLVKNMAKSSTPNFYVTNAKNAAESLKSVLRTNPWEEANHLEIIPAATVASLLIDVVICIENICEAVEELASLANFVPYELLHRGTTVQPICDEHDDGSVHVITVNE